MLRVSFWEFVVVKLKFETLHLFDLRCIIQGYFRDIDLEYFVGWITIEFWTYDAF